MGMKLDSHPPVAEKAKDLGVPNPLKDINSNWINLN
jgi:hypothetical protein